MEKLADMLTKALKVAIEHEPELWLRTAVAGAIDAGLTEATIQDVVNEELTARAEEIEGVEE